MKDRLAWRRVAFLLLLGALLGASSWAAERTLAQQETPAPDAPIWARPVNVSQSGSATAPQLIVDGAGSVHLLWRDSVDAFGYSVRSGSSWQAATTVNAPFAPNEALQRRAATVVELAADGQGSVHAFWLNEDSALLHSRVDRAAVAAGPWTPQQQLAPAAADLTTARDASGRLHLAYVQSADSPQSPAGIYYRQWTPDANAWSAPVLLAASRYFRVLPTGSDALQLATGRGSSSQLIVAWENVAQQQLLAVHSADSGANWSQPTIIDQREESDLDGSDRPQRARLAATASGFMLVWQAGHDDAQCAPYFSTTASGGRRWSERQPLVSEDVVDACSDAFFLLTDSAGRPLVMQGAAPATLRAWDGDRWSLAQSQSELAALDNPATFQPLALGCLTPQFLPSNALLVAGCTAAPAADVWVTERTVADTEAWFPVLEPPIWQPPLLTALDEAISADFTTIATAPGQLLTLWLSDAGALTAMRFNANRWGRPQPVLPGPLRHAHVAATADNRLVAALTDIASGRVLFAQAQLDRASSAAEWSEPLPVAATDDASGAAITVRRDGHIFILFSVPVNDGRGLYATDSADHGETWSTPRLIFDGASAGWTQVGVPTVATTGDDYLHVLWPRLGLDGAPEELVMMHSADNGRTWSDPASVTETPGAWQALLGVGERTVHRVWQETTGDRTVTRHAFSQDNGVTWSRPTQVGAGGAAALTLDAVARPHLLLAGDNAVAHQIWQDERWQPLDPVAFDAVPTALSATFMTEDTLALVQLRPAQDTAAGASMAYTQRMVEVPEIRPTPLPPLTPTPTSTPAPTATPQPTPVPTIAFPTERGSDGLVPPLLGRPELSNIALAAVAGLTIVGLLFAASVRVTRRR